MFRGVFHVWCLIRGGGRLAPIPWTDRQLIPKDLEALEALWHTIAEHAFFASHVRARSVRKQLRQVGHEL